MLELVLYLFVIQYLPLTDGCGAVTHMMISGRAKEFYNNSDRYVNYRQLLDIHKDALLAGSAYPDSFYDSPCFNDIYHNISEDTHWTPFLNASINYIRRTYPHPWSWETEKLVVFLFGIVSHQVADILWHSLGVSQGFLTTMAAINFHGDYSAAHPFGDAGGEFVSVLDLDADLIIDLEKWYVPTQDLYNIYKEFYGAVKLTDLEIELCSSELLIESYGVVLAKNEIYPGVVDRSPFLVGEMENYFHGGVNDMAGWTQRSWDNVVTMLEQGVSMCNMTYNPLYVTCNKTSTQGNHKDRQLKNGHYVRYRKHGLTLEDFKVTKLSRGITIEPNTNLKKLIQQRKEEIYFKKKVLHEEIVRSMFVVNGSYARFGWTMSSGDVDSDGYQDVIIGSPGYSHVNNWQRGRIYIIYGPDPIPEACEVNLDRFVIWLNTTYIDGPDQMQSRFGTGVTVLDINQDGIDDIAIGSPAFGNNSPLDYNGLISIYLGQKNKRQYTKPDIVITCQVQYCNLGYTFDRADVNHDGFPDLIIGLPYYSSEYEQSGIVAAFMSSKQIKTGQTYRFEDLTWKLLPEKPQPYAWFGHSIRTKDSKLIVNSPYYRKCFLSNCSYSDYDIQSIGRSDIFSLDRKMSNFSIIGTSHYQSAGYSVDFGYPYDNRTLVMAYSIPGNDVEGRLNFITENIYRAGSVLLVNYTGKMSDVLAQFDGNRKYAKFGYVTKFADLNNDGYDDLIISEPYRIKSISEIQHNKNGRFYIFYGGHQMPKGKATFSSKCDQEQPCAAKVANFTSRTSGEQSNNGYFIYTVKMKNGVELYSSDVTSDAGIDILGAGRRSGVVWRYDFPH